MRSDFDVVEFGCGTGYVSAWLARRGGRCIGLDNSAKQLETARMLQREFDLSFPLVHADAERAPFADGSFDFAISEYGAAIWCDPYRWIPEAARLLRPGGRLVFLCYSNLIMLCMRESESEAATAELLRDLFGMHRFEWDEGDGVEFAIPHGEMVRLLRRSGFEIEDLMRAQGAGGSDRADSIMSLRSGRAGGRAKRSGRLGRSGSRLRTTPRVQPSAGGSIAARTKLITSRSRRFSDARPLSAPTTTLRTLASVSDPTTPV